MDLFGKKKTKAAIDREQKEKVDLDRAHSQQIKQELNEIRMMPYRTDLAMEEINQFDSLLAQAATIADQLPPVAFDVTGIETPLGGQSRVGRVRFRRRRQQNHRIRQRQTRLRHAELQGRIHRRREQEIKIQPGVDNGTRLRVPGAGEMGTNGGSPGDLYIVMEVRDHPVFQRDGQDLHRTVSIPWPQAVMGGKSASASHCGGGEKKPLCLFHHAAGGAVAPI